jgi:hypothetical protein
VVNSLFPVQIIIFGVVNPNLLSEVLTAGVKNINLNYYKEVCYTSSGYQPTSTGIPLTFNQITTSSNYIRTTASYAISFVT